jgi:PAS domain S-box-containing protein
MLNGLERLKALTATLDDGEQQLCDFFHHSPDLMCVLDQSGKFVRVNSAWCNLIGRDCVDKTLESLVHESDRRSLNELLKRLYEGDVYRLRLKIMGKDWKYRVIEFSATQWRNGISNLVGRILPESYSGGAEVMPRFNRRTHGDDHYEAR